MNKFCTGNIVRKDSDYYVVVGGYFDKLTLVPFRHSNMTIHLPDEAIYEEREYEDDYGNVKGYSHKLMDGINEYELVAHNIDQFIMNKMKKIFYEN